MTDDQERQVQVYSNLDMWDRKNPRVIRRHLIEEAVTANHRLVRFIGLDAYEAAGGGVTRDLFTDEGDLDGICLTDMVLVEQLALSKLQETVASLTTEGWAWAEATLDTESVSSRYGHVYPQSFDLTQEQQATVNKLQTQERALIKEIAALEEKEGEKGDEDEWRALNQQLDDLQEQIRAIEDQCEAFTVSQKTVAGCIVSVNYQGQLSMHKGLSLGE